MKERVNAIASVLGVSATMAPRSPRRRSIGTVPFSPGKGGGGPLSLRATFGGCMVALALWMYYQTSHVSDGMREEVIESSPKKQHGHHRQSGGAQPQEQRVHEAAAALLVEQYSGREAEAGGSVPSAPEPPRPAPGKGGGHAKHGHGSRAGEGPQGGAGANNHEPPSLRSALHQRGHAAAAAKGGASASSSAREKEREKEKEKEAKAHAAALAAAAAARENSAAMALPVGGGLQSQDPMAVYIPEPINGKEWFEWDQFTSAQYVSNLTFGCRMPWDAMRHNDKNSFFQTKPMCGYLNQCDGELPPIDDSKAKVTMEYAGYIEQYSDRIRYMHMAMLGQLPSGTLLSAWQASPIVLDDLQERDMLAVEGLDLQHIRMSYSRDKEGRAWSASKRIPIPQKAALWSPVLHVDPTTGVTWLFYSESTGCRKSNICNPCVPRLRRPCRRQMPWEIEICHTDPPLYTPGGHIKVITSANPLAPDPKWSKPRLLLSSQSGGGIPKVICNRMAVLKTGEWLLPYWREQTPGAVEDGTCKVHIKDEIEVMGPDGQNRTKQPPPGSDCYADFVGACSTGAREYHGVLRSVDGGKTWSTRGSMMLPNTHLIEGTLAELNNGTVLMIFRTSVGCLHKTLSMDKGLTWSQAEPMNLPNPNSKVHLMRLEPEGHLLLAFNNHRGAGNYRGLKNCKGCRSKLHIAMSRDDGDTWRHIVSLDDEMSSSAVRIHYPCMMQLGEERRIMVTYSRFYLARKLGLSSPDQGVVIMRLNLEEVMKNLDDLFEPFPPPSFLPQGR